ncbi:MAG: NAD(P)/FAD-dependent oxidoreductase [Fibrobacterota bacterium]
MTLLPRYDLVGAGAGPAGCVSAHRAARAGLSVLLCEKRPQVGLPVRCAELTGYEHEVARYIPVSSEFVRGRIRFCELTTPAGMRYRRAIPTPPLQLDRTKFDLALFRQAENAGAHTVTETEVAALHMDSRGFAEAVTVTIKSRPVRIGCGFVAGADGVESVVGRLAGLETTCPLRDIYTCLQYRVECTDIEPGVIRFFIGNTVAPHGYIWVFPRGTTSANIGIALLRKGRVPVSLAEHLDAFLLKHYASARITDHMAGGIPADGGLKRFVKGNVALLGDAAHHANPFSGGGIMNSMEDAELFTDTLLHLRDHGRPHRLYTYEKTYQKRYGRILRWQRTGRNVFYSLSDKSMERLFSLLSKALPDDNFEAHEFERAVKKVMGFTKLLEVIKQLVKTLVPDRLKKK